MNCVTLLSVVCVLFIVSFCAHATVDNSAAVNFILTGLEEIKETGSAPGVLSINGENAFPLLLGKSENILKPIVGGAKYGDGRIICFPHTNIMPFEFGDDPEGYDNLQFLLNTVKWAAYRPGKVGISGFGGSSGVRLTRLLTSIGHSVEAFTFRQITDILYLRQFQLLIMVENSNFETDSTRYQIVKDYVRIGGGLILGATPWSYSYPPGDNSMDNYWANNFSDSGISYVKAQAYKTTANGFNASLAYLEEMQAQGLGGSN